MGDALTLALAANEDPLAPVLSESWTSPGELSDCHVPDTVDLASVCTVATEILFLLSGRKFGVRTETVRPRTGAVDGYGLPVGVATSGGRLFGRREGEPCWLILKSPVQQILEVKVDGVVLDSGQYRLYDNRKLVRVPAAPGANNLWPLRQRLELDDTQVDTFSVSYQWGVPVPEGGKVAAQTFACQLAKYVNRDADCALPDRVLSVTRQGVSQTLIDPSDLIKASRTGLYLCDSWLAAVNPHGNRRRPTITSPDDVELVRPT